MERLRDQIGETVSLYVRDGFERIRIQAVQSREAVRRVAPVGVRLPLYVGASSKVLAAHAGPGICGGMAGPRQLARGFDLDAFLAQLETGAEKGLPPVSKNGKPAPPPWRSRFSTGPAGCGGVVRIGPSSRFSFASMNDHAALLKEAAERMGKMVG